VAIACILSMNPEVLVFDEPLAGLDKKSQDWLTAFLKELQKTGKRCCFPPTTTIWRSFSGPALLP